MRQEAPAGAPSQPDPSRPDLPQHDLSQPDLSHLDLLRRAAVVLTTPLEPMLAEVDLTLDQWRVLHVLAGRGPLAMSDLGAATGVPGPTLTRIVDRLVDRSLAYRNVDAADRRRVLVHAAERGAALHRALGPRVAVAERAGLSPLSGSETETLRRLLERLAGTPSSPGR
jgi:DNA-binding MarR family transcriptional regulator